jgi:hypothetical protein
MECARTISRSLQPSRIKACSSSPDLLRFSRSAFDIRNILHAHRICQRILNVVGPYCQTGSERFAVQLGFRDLGWIRRRSGIALDSRAFGPCGRCGPVVPGLGAEAPGPSLELRRGGSGGPQPHKIRRFLNIEPQLRFR